MSKKKKIISNFLTVHNSKINCPVLLEIVKNILKIIHIIKRCNKCTCCNSLNTRSPVNAILAFSDLQLIAFTFPLSWNTNINCMTFKKIFPFEFEKT